MLDHRVKKNKSIVEVFSYPVPIVCFPIIPSKTQDQDRSAPPWNHSGTWDAENNNYYCLGGYGEGTCFYPPGI